MSSSGELFDYLLGEGERVERESVRRCVAEQPEVALELAELGLMLDSLRSISLRDANRRNSVSPCLSPRLRYVALRRARLRGSRFAEVPSTLTRVLVIAAGMTLLLYLAQGLLSAPSVEPAITGPGVGPTVVTFAVDPSVEGLQAHPEPAALLASERAPVSDASFLHSLERYSARALPADFGSWLQADNLLRRLREEQRLRRSAVERRRVLSALGSPDLGDRIDSLSATIAEQARAGQADTDVAASSLTLRALLASGSTSRSGPHQDVVRSCSRHLIHQLPDLDGVELVRALAGLSDLAVVDGAPLAGLVAKHCDRLARSILRPPAGDGSAQDRPPLLSWRSPVASLADAGQVLELAPAFGAHSGLAFRARLMVAAHLGERLELSERELPSLRAAELYGFGDLVDRNEIDRELLLWRPRMLLPDYEALYHLAFSKFPARAGWARFQRELRGLAAAPTPAEIGDSAALLLCLCSNFAAPGSLDIVQLLAAR